jgi:hypothetical protein
MIRFSSLSTTYQVWLRRVAILAGVSFGLALLLTGYLFGTSDAFFSRLFGAFFVFFWLLAVTFLGVVPFINWAAANWFGKGWRAVPTVSSGRRIRTTTATGNSTSRKTTSTAKRLK